MPKRPAIVIMAKQPAAGRTKTRLCPPLTPEAAAALYKAMLRDTIALVAGLERVQVAVAVTPPEAVDEFEGFTPPGTRLLPVACDDLGECLRRVIGCLLADGHPAVLALNSDGPTLPAGCLRRAVDEVHSTGVVLGPSEDGGYYLIGMRQPHPGLFEGIAWSTDQVAVQTLERAQALGLRVALLPAWYDVDTPADLERLRAEVTTLPSGVVQHTRRFFVSRNLGGEV